MFVEICYNRLRYVLVWNIEWKGIRAVLYYYSANDLIRTSRIIDGYSYLKDSRIVVRSVLGCAGNRATLWIMYM